MDAKTVLATTALALLVATPAASQIPETFSNLQILDPEIERRALIAIMRSWAGDLGVRCTHCHGGRDDLQGTDFAADELAAKRTARRMLAMVRAIETAHLAALPSAVEDGRRPAQTVTCYTCHRGSATPPRESTALLREVVTSVTPGAALARYDELRATEADSGKYDLRPVVLFRLARGAMEAGALDAALVLLDGLHEREPTMGDAYALRAQIELARNDLAAAEAALAHAREVEPEARLADWVQGLVDRYRAGLER